ncbi:hypothetical protein [Streptomyces sp. NBC_00233]|uniref:hypothetical protein n=1 Tax=Streptomyces sp. NBC_00233 TaxID=2975686 RepID=UPI00224D9A31|nr:hypothetical protein [Streptomyces sp. NBC_00233]MCX5229676.1 hypothetical protein [Streptomyces sp. NBC_00233]
MTSYTVESPRRDFTGESVGVHFHKGTGQVDDSTKDGRAAIEYFRRQGYALTPETEDEPDVEEPQDGWQEPFAPAAHDVTDVLAYLEIADLDEALRVLDAEAAAKKPRTTITGKREDILAAKTPEATAGDDTKGAGQ